MTCQSAREWIVTAEAPADIGSASEDAAAHIRQCPACQKIIAEIGSIERCWRDLPISPRAETSKAAFLKRLANSASPVPTSPKSKPRRWKRVLAWTTAAAVFAAAGAGVLFFWPSQQVVEAHPDVIEQLVDWNLELTEAPTQADRERIFVENHEKLLARMKQAKLNDADRDLAEHLLDNGHWLAKNDDPVEELHRYNRMADRLMEKLEAAAAKADAAQSDRMARQYAKIAERGIDGNLARIKVAKVVDPDRRQRIKQMMKEDQDRSALLTKLAEKGPVATQKELRRALELSSKRHKIKKGEKAA